MTAFDNTKSVWQWEFASQTQQTYSAAVAAAGGAFLLAKIMDGLNFAGSWDPGNVIDINTWQAVKNAASGFVIPWVVPRGRNPMAEAQAHAALVAGTSQPIVLDLEPYSGFWDQGPLSGLTTYLAELRAAGASAIFAAIDPRPVGYTPFPPFSDLVDGFLPECYWTAFQQPYTYVMPLIKTILSWGKPVYPVLDGMGANGDIANVWDQSKALGCTGCSIWRLGGTTPTALAQFAVLDLPPSPPDVPDVPDAIERLNTAIQQAAAIQGQAQALGSSAQTLLDNLHGILADLDT